MNKKDRITAANVLQRMIDEGRYKPSNPAVLHRDASNYMCNSLSFALCMTGSISRRQKELGQKAIKKMLDAIKEENEGRDLTLVSVLRRKILDVCTPPDTTAVYINYIALLRDVNTPLTPENIEGVMPWA